MKYLERFSSLIPAIQGNKALRKIEEMRERGEVQTEAEYNAALEEVLSNISTTEFKPLFVFTPLKPGISSAESFNAMLDTIRDDLEVIYMELNNIFAAIKAHDLLFKDKLLDELHFTLRELENKADSLGTIGDSSNSFDSVHLNSFNGDNYVLDRNSPFANEILVDTRRDIRIPNENLAFIDVNEKVISLPLASQEDIPFVGASVRTADTTATQVDIQLIDSDISNILDSDSSSSWAYNILLKEPAKNGAKLSLELDLGDKREINYLNIHPVSDFPVLCEKIQFVNINNNIEDLPDTSVFNKTLENPIRITFPDIIAKKVILRLSQSSCILFDHNKNKTKITFDDLKRNTGASRSVAVLSDNIKKDLKNPNLLDIIPTVDNQNEIFDVYNQYVFAFRDISAGLSSYKDDGYFISKKYEKATPALIALDAVENIPEYTDPEANVVAKTASFEYSIVKKDFNGARTLLKTSEFPVLPPKKNHIDDERLFFSAERKVIPLRFLGHSTGNTGANIKIFRNNIELVRGVNWRFFDRLNPLDNSDFNLKPNLIETRIEILDSNDLINSGVYIAKYTPRFISEPNEVVKVKDITYLPNGSTEHPATVGAEKIESSDLFVKIAIRNNSNQSNRTPKLDSYKLLTSSVNKDKYVRI